MSLSKKQILFSQEANVTMYEIGHLRKTHSNWIRQIQEGGTSAVIENHKNTGT